MNVRNPGCGQRTILWLVLVLGLLQALDFHSSVTAHGVGEANRAITQLSEYLGDMVSLGLAKLVALGAIGCMYVVWRRCPTLRCEVTIGLAVSVIASGLVVLSNYGAAP